MTPVTIQQHFRRAGLGHLLRHATLILFLTGEARAALEEELRALLLQIGTPPADVPRYASWTLHMASLNLLGSPPR